MSNTDYVNTSPGHLGTSPSGMPQPDYDHGSDVKQTSVQAHPDQDDRAAREKLVAQQKTDFEDQKKVEHERHLMRHNIRVAGERARDRSLAVQEEISTRVRDGVMPNSPAALERHERIRKEFGELEKLDAPDELEEIAARLMHATPSGCESMALELAEIAVKIRGSNKRKEDPNAPKDASGRPIADYSRSNAAQTATAASTAAAMHEDQHLDGEGFGVSDTTVMPGANTASGSKSFDENLRSYAAEHQGRPGYQGSRSGNAQGTAPAMKPIIY
jgi:hypothetical protein